jgi:chemotaxis protein MotD
MGAVADAATALPPGTPSSGRPKPLPPDTLIPSLPARGAPTSAVPPVEERARDAVATVAVLRRETHLALPREAAALTGQLQAASQPGSRAGGTGAEEPGVATRAGTGAEEVAAASPAVSHQAVTAARGSDTGEQLRQGREAFSARRPATEARSGSDDVRTEARAGSDQAAPAARGDAHTSSTPAPTPASTPAQQIAARIATEVGAATQAGRPEAAGFAPLAQPQLGSAVKVLHIQLQPAGLGTVTVRLSLKDHALRLDMEVGRGDTAHLIQREREALSSLLRSAGYLVDGLDVRVADQAAPGQQAMGSGQTGMQTPGEGQAGSSQADGRPQGARPQDQRRGNPFASGRNDEDEQTGHPGRRSDIYV